MTMGLPSKFQFRDQWYGLAPPLLRTGVAERYMYTLQLCTDLLLEKMNEAIRFRFPGNGADPSQLPYLANDRVLVQGPAEPDATFAVRLSQAFNTWGLAGSSRAVLSQIQAYAQNLQPGVPATNPLAMIVSGSYSGYANWWIQYQGDALGATPTLQREAPSNFDWNGQLQPWRSWLILPMALVAVAGLNGTGAATSSASGGSFTSPGQNASAASYGFPQFPSCWVPATSGTAVNAPFLTITGLSGMSSAQVGQWLTLSGSSHAGNNTTCQIVQVPNPGSAVIANVNGVASDAGPLTWSVSAYPWIGPGPVFGSHGVVYGEGELTIPPVDTGENFQGVWQPTIGLSEGTGTTISFGLSCSPETVISLRGLVKTWKSAPTYYSHMIVAFDCGNGTAGNAYSPNSSPGAGNPDGSFGPVGKNASAAAYGYPQFPACWVPTRLISSEYDAYCQGTGSWQWCSVENVN